MCLSFYLLQWRCRFSQEASNWYPGRGCRPREIQSEVGVRQPQFGLARNFIHGQMCGDMVFLLKRHVGFGPDMKEVPDKDEAIEGVVGPLEEAHLIRQRFNEGERDIRNGGWYTEGELIEGFVAEGGREGDETYVEVFREEGIARTEGNADNGIVRLVLEALHVRRVVEETPAAARDDTKIIPCHRKHLRIVHNRSLLERHPGELVLKGVSIVSGVRDLVDQAVIKGGFFEAVCAFI